MAGGPWSLLAEQKPPSAGRNSPSGNNLQASFGHCLEQARYRARPEAPEPSKCRPGWASRICGISADQPGTVCCQHVVASLYVAGFPDIDAVGRLFADGCRACRLGAARGTSAPTPPATQNSLLGHVRRARADARADKLLRKIGPTSRKLDNVVRSPSRYCGCERARQSSAGSASLLL